MDIKETVITFKGKKYPCLEFNGMHYELGTNPEIIRALDMARRCNTRVRLFLGDTATGKAWEEENDVCGYIGHSTGPKMVPLLINNKRSLGGGAILTDSIVAIMSVPGQFLYKHPSFNPGTFNAVLSDMPEYKSAATDETGKIIARFKHETGARRWVDFMSGRRMSK